jgi:hypothetical protein
MHSNARFQTECQSFLQREIYFLQPACGGPHCRAVYRLRFRFNAVIDRCAASPRKLGRYSRMNPAAIQPNSHMTP